MQALAQTVQTWLAAGHRVALATVVKVYGSAPRPLGSKMAVSDAGAMVGSVSGGCVEGAVFELAGEVLETGQPQLVPFGISDELAFEAVGLACGGTIEVFIEPLTTAPMVTAAPRRAVVTALSGPHLGQKLVVAVGDEPTGHLTQTDLAAQLAADAVAQLKTGQTVRRTYTTPQGEVEVFIEIIAPPPRLIIVGAVHIAMALVEMGKVLGFETVVVDARSAFATPARFPHADRLAIGWPAEVLAELALDAGSYLVFLTHDDKLDNPGLVEVLKHEVRYVGALGSKGTHAKRLAALRQMGVAEADLARIHAPIGLSIGAKTPEQIAVAIAAELVAVQNQT